MTTQEILEELSHHGSENTRRVLIRHDAREPFFGVKVQDLKKFQKAIKKDYQLLLELFETGVSDVMYLFNLTMKILLRPVGQHFLILCP